VTSAGCFFRVEPSTLAATERPRPAYSLSRAIERHASTPSIGIWINMAPARSTPVGRAITTFSGSANAKPCA